MSDATHRPDGAPPSEPWAAAVAAAFGLSDSATALSGRDLLALDEISQVWLVLEGSLNVFLTDDDGQGGLAGRRHGLAQLAAGALAFGLPHPEGGSRVVGVPGAGARIATVSTADLAARAESLSDSLAPALEHWIAALGEAAFPEPPADSKALLHPGETLAPGEARTVEAADGLVWARPSGGAAHFVGALAVPEGRAVPLLTGTWLAVAPETAVEGQATAELFAARRDRSDWRTDLAAFHHILLQHRLDELEAARRAEWDRLASRREAENQAFDGAIGSLSTVGLAHQAAAATAPGEPLVGAAELVAKAGNIETRLPKGGLEAVARARDPLGTLAESSGFHTLAVELEGEWWRSDQGPLLAYLGAERHPIALLQPAPGRYEAVDPVTGRRTPISAGSAKGFARDAVSFVRLLPGHALDTRDVIANGVKGLGPDLRRLGIAMGLAGTVTLAIPLIVEQIIGTAVPEADRTSLLVLVMAMVAVSLAGAGFSIVQSLALIRIEGRAAARTHLAVFARMLRLPTDFFRDHTAGDLSVRIRGVEEMRQLLSDNVLFIVMASVNGLISLGLMIYFEPTLGLVVAGVAVILGLLNYLFGGRAVALQRRLLHLRGDVESDVVQYIDGITELRTNNAERQAFARWSGKFAANQAAAFEAGRFTNAGQTANAAFSFTAVLAIVIAIGLVSGQLFAVFEQDISWSSVAATGLDGAINAAQFMAFYTAFGQFSTAVNQVVQSILNLTALLPTYDRLRPLLETEEEHQPGDLDPGRLRGEVEVRDVQFRYVQDGPLVLKGVSLTAKAGQFIAVVGPSGAGKSSLMRLILGFDAPEAGSVFLDGMDLRQLNKRAVRRNFGVVLQAVKVMTGSIYENITSGTGLSEEEAWWAAEQVGFAEDIRRMPDGMHTMLTDGGSTLSGGQCQRLMLARAIIRQPRIMLLDEATSALDNEVQSVVTQAMDKLNCTRIVIAHRLSTIANADLIYVIDAGHLVEHGTYDELMKLDGVFAELARRQLAR
jgi:NHLM bacteriocin system ABC transporter ATP-binding protein